MGLWETRGKALDCLRSSLREEATVIEDSFGLIDECIERHMAVESSFARVCGLTLVKGRSLAAGVYSLLLDGLGQEAGALLRPLIETIELLVYLRLEPARVEQAINGRLPSAGKIAKKIQGRFKNLHDHLSEHASHFGFTFESLKHFVDLQELIWRPVQDHNEVVLRTNLGVLFLFLNGLTIEGVNCVSVAQAMIDNGLAHRVESHRERGYQLFAPEEEAPSE